LTEEEYLRQQPSKFQAAKFEFAQVRRQTFSTAVARLVCAGFPTYSDSRSLRIVWSYDPRQCHIGWLTCRHYSIPKAPLTDAPLIIRTCLNDAPQRFEVHRYMSKELRLPIFISPRARSLKHNDAVETFCLLDELPDIMDYLVDIAIDGKSDMGLPLSFDGWTKRAYAAHSKWLVRVNEIDLVEFVTAK
jgi:hypothetical protein